MSGEKRISKRRRSLRETSEDESLSVSGVSLKSDASMGHPLTFGDGQPKRLKRSGEDASSVSGVSLKSDASMGHPLTFGDKQPKRLKRSGEDASSVSGVSLKSDASMGHPLTFGDKQPKSLKKSGEDASSVSGESLKSDASMGHPLTFGDKQPKSLNRSGEDASSVSGVSLKSDASMGHPLTFGVGQSKGLIMGQGEPSSVSGVSLKSDASMGHPLTFGVGQSKRVKTSEDEGPGVSGVSSRSDASMGHPMTFHRAKIKLDDPTVASTCSVCKEDVKDPVRYICGHSSCRQCVSSDWDQSDSSTDHPCNNCKDTRKNNPLETKKNHKEAMQKKFAVTSEGNGDRQIFLDSIYASLFITAGESEGPHEEHAFRHVKHKLQSKKLVSLSGILQDKNHRTVLTKGVAGIGKSLAVQKFVLDWAKGRENQDVDFVFCFAFRELNLITDEKSLDQILTEFHPEIQSLEDCAEARAIVILDGLDESRFELDFEDKSLTSVSEVSSVGNVLANVINGNLLRQAKVWITSRPAAANQIPAKCVDKVTEIKGFSDQQKKEYFLKRFSTDPDLARRIISHIGSSQSLDIMCQIPIFCWICAILFQEIFGHEEETEIPQTLTEMMAHYVFAQTKRGHRKFGKKTEKNKQSLLKMHKEFLLKLGKLAFVHLQKNNLIVYKKDLEECGMDIKEATIYSGFFNAFLKDEEIFSQEKVFFFVHLTVQEFFAALFVYDCFTNKNTKELADFLKLKDKEHTLLDLLKMTVEKVLEKKNGHLDFFLRFLFGLIVEDNRRVLGGLLTSLDPSQDTEKKILTHLKAIRRKALTPDASINLFQTMVEMRDHKVKDEIEEYLKMPDPSQTELTPLHCSALAYMMQVSKNDLEEIDLKSYKTSEEGRRRLIPAVRSCRKAILADCKVTPEWIEHLAVGLKFPYVPLRDLDLSNNDLTDSGVELLCQGLSYQGCKLKKLSLSGCQITENGCASLAAALRSNPSHLMELDLSYNHPGDSGAKLLSDLKDDQQYKLKELNLDHGGVLRMQPGFKKYPCELSLDPSTAHKKLHLSEENRKVTWVDEGQQHPDPKTQERSEHCQQVLCEQGLDKRHYWEMEVCEPFTVGLMYKTIDSKGDLNQCKLEPNDKSWFVTCSNKGCYVVGCNEKVDIASVCMRSSRLGVYLDLPAGSLSFYKVSSDSRTHLHTFRTRFTEPLYPAVELHAPSSVSFRKLT